MPENLLISSYIYLVEENQCEKPKTCVPLPQCHTLFNVIVDSQNSTLSEANRNLLAQSQCGWEDKTPLVKQLLASKYQKRKIILLVWFM